MVKLNGQVYLMMNEKISEEKILNAAREVFMEKGLDGARMQEIANKAGINKAMLHYYFRSKNKLFEKVFAEAFKDFWPQMESAILSERSSAEVFASIIEAYLTVFTQNPYLPNFILSEIHRSPEHLERLMKEIGLNPGMMIHFVDTLIENGFLKSMDSREFLINILSLCIFPFAARPLISRLMWENDDKEFELFVQGRKASIMHIIETCYIIKSE